MRSMKTIYKYIPENVKRIIRDTSFYKRKKIKEKSIVRYSEIDNILNKAPKLFLEQHLKEKPIVGIIQSQNNNLVERYVNPKASWLRYERFCKNNNIPYDFLDIRKSNWIEEAKKFDIIICHTESSPEYQLMMEDKIYILEKIMNKFCFPSFHELWQYENKNRSLYLYHYFKLPCIPTQVTNDKKEAIELVTNRDYPFITKTFIGAGSTGVTKIESRSKALAMINKIFGYKGKTTQYPYFRQKDYFYIQDFMEDAKFDLRIMLVGNKAFGYYRYPKKGDFKASGSGITEKKEIPIEAIRLAIEIRQKLNSRQMGVDLMYSPKSKKYYIIETSLFNQIDTPVQFAINNIPGYYDISDKNDIQFKEGKFWVQELMIRELIIEWAENKEYLITHEYSKP